MLELRTIPAGELPILYDHMRRDFPMRERIPYFVLQSAAAKGALIPFFLTEGSEDAGYAVCTLPEGKPYAHIQYLATLPFCRGMGYGSRLLELLAERFPDRVLILDAENPEYARTGREYRTRKRRIAFYERAGFAVQKNIGLNLFGVRMLCLAKSSSPIENPSDVWQSCYLPLLPAFWVERLVSVYSAPDTGRSVIRPGRYRHFKGGIYEVIGVARHSETLEPMVVYRALYGEGGYWVRPASMWNETIERDGIRQRRFTYIGR